MAKVAIVRYCKWKMESGRCKEWPGDAKEIATPPQESLGQFLPVPPSFTLILFLLSKCWAIFHPV